MRETYNITPKTGDDKDLDIFEEDLFQTPKAQEYLSQAYEKRQQQEQSQPQPNLSDRHELTKLIEEKNQADLKANNSPAIDNFTAYQVARSHWQSKPNDIGLGQLSATLEKRWQNSQGGSLTIGDIASLRDVFSKTFPQSAAKTVLGDEIPKVSYLLTLPIRQLKIAGERINDESEYVAECRRLMIDGNGIRDIQARKYLLEIVNGKRVAQFWEGSKIWSKETGEEGEIVSQQTDAQGGTLLTLKFVDGKTMILPEMEVVRSFNIVGKKAQSKQPKFKAITDRHFSQDTNEKDNYINFIAKQGRADDEVIKAAVQGHDGIKQLARSLQATGKKPPLPERSAQTASQKRISEALTGFTDSIRYNFVEGDDVTYLVGKTTYKGVVDRIVNEGISIKTPEGLLNFIASNDIEKFRVSHIPKIPKISQWETLPKGWTEESLRSFWNSVGGSEHECAAKIKGKVDDPDAFCASLKDKMKGTTKWRGKGERTAEEPTPKHPTSITDAIDGTDLGDKKHLEIPKSIVQDNLDTEQAKLLDRVDVSKDTALQDGIFDKEDVGGGESEKVGHQAINEYKQIIKGGNNMKQPKKKEGVDQAQRDYYKREYDSSTVGRLYSDSLTREVKIMLDAVKEYENILKGDPPEKVSL